jgi:hypothetical protein
MLVCIIFKNSVRTSRRTLNFTITKIKWLMLFKEIIPVCGDNFARHLNIKFRFVDY